MPKQKLAVETPYSIAEAAQASGLSRQTITRLFENEPGVIILGRPERMHKKPYRTIKIPRHVYTRVVARLTVAADGRAAREAARLRPRSSLRPVSEKGKQ